MYTATLKDHNTKQVICVFQFRTQTEFYKTWASLDPGYSRYSVRSDLHGVPVR